MEIIEEVEDVEIKEKVESSEIISR